MTNSRSPDDARPGRKKPAYRKRFGQHHLRHGGLCDPLVAFLRPDGLDAIEIGPGGGVLTAELVRAGARVTALEVDLSWIAFLSRRARREFPSLRLVAMDALGFAWERVERPTVVAGNLPFNVGTPIVEAWMEAAQAAPDLLPRAGFMVQKEVADRLVARPGDSAYGGLSIVAAARSRVRRLGVVPASGFVPPPKVDGAYVGLEPVAAPVSPERLDALFALVRSAFARRRKTLRNNLAAAWDRDRAAEVLDVAGIDGGRRAETLELADFVGLLDAADRNP